MRVSRMLPLAACLAALGGCLGDTLTGLELPAGSSAFRFVVGDSIAERFHLIDTASVPAASGGGKYDYELTMLGNLGFGGVNCIGLLPKSVTDTTGTFSFVYSGTNNAVVRERNHTTTDTTFYPILFQTQGTHGAYVVNSAGKVTLTWADGTPVEYFDPTATITLKGDTLTSNVELSYYGDSLHVSWHLTWVRGTCQ